MIRPRPQSPSAAGHPPAGRGDRGVVPARRAARSVANQEADKIIGERRPKLNQDAEQEQVEAARFGQELANDRAKLTPEQICAKETELRDRVTESTGAGGPTNAASAHKQP